MVCYANIALTGEEQAQEQSEAQLTDQAQTLINAGQLAGAQNMLQAAIRKYPRSGALYNLLGIIAAEQNRNAEAESAFLTATRYAPSLSSAILNLARVYYSEGKDDAAIVTYRRALKINNNLPEANANLATLLLDKGNYAEAQSRLALLPAEDREQNRFRAMECAASAGAEKFDRAKEAARQVTGTVTEQDVSLPAYVLTKLGQSELVIDLLTRVDIENSSKELRGLLATAYAKSGNPARARALFESVAREEPKDVRPLSDAAHVAYQERDYEGAAGYLAHALKIEPENADVQFFFGIVCVHLNLPGDAFQALKEAVRLKPITRPSTTLKLDRVTGFSGAVVSLNDLERLDVLLRRGPWLPTFGNAVAKFGQLPFNANLDFGTMRLISIKDSFLVACCIPQFVSTPRVHGNTASCPDHLKIANQRMGLTQECHGDLSGDTAPEMQEHLTNIFHIAAEIRVSSRSRNALHFIAREPAQAVHQMNA
jgi:Tfp pilus assembly protein PilF